MCVMTSHRQKHCSGFRNLQVSCLIRILGLHRIDVYHLECNTDWKWSKTEAGDQSTDSSRILCSTWHVPLVFKDCSCQA
jgi:hypothetical protein